MLKKICLISLFLLFTALIFLSLEYTARQLFKNKDDIAKADEFSKINSNPIVGNTFNNQDVKIIITGASHAAHSIDASAFSFPILNITNTSQDLYYDMQIFKKCVFAKQGYGYVIVFLDYFSFGYDEAAVDKNQINIYNGVGIPLRTVFIKSGFNSPNKRNYFTIKELLNNFSSNLDYLFWQNFYFYKYRSIFIHQIIFNLFYKKHIHNKEINLNNSALMDLKSSKLEDKEWEENNLSRGRLHISSLCYNKKNELFNKHCLLEILQTALSKKMKIFILIPPTPSSYRAAFNASFIENFKSNLQDVLYQIKKKDIKFMDYSENEFFKRDDYGDEHLNGNGAIKFSHIINDLIKNL